MWDTELIFVLFPIIQRVVILGIWLLEKNLIIVRQAL